MIRSISLITLILLAAGARAEDLFWVSVASYNEAAAAETIAATVSGTLGEPMSVSGVETGGGYFYRVLAGPYTDRGQAEAVLERADLAGMSGAWVIPDSTGSIQASIVGGGADAYEVEGIGDLELSDTYDASDYSSDYTPPPQPERTDQPERQMVEEPPPGYRLHKLRRDD